MTPGRLDVDIGLRTRLLEAGAAVAWRPAPRSPRRTKGRAARIAHLHDEEARVETWGSESDGGVEVESGPLGALVLLLEVDRRGPPSSLEPRSAGDDPAFPAGAIRATWGRATSAGALGLHDLVELARYALR